MATKVNEVAEIVEKLGMTVEELGDAIDRIDNTMRTLSSGRLNRKALIVLISYQSKLGQGEVEKVISALESLRSAFLNPEK